jgi:hypothetical protein
MLLQNMEIVKKNRVYNTGNVFILLTMVKPSGIEKQRLLGHFGVKKWLDIKALRNILLLVFTANLPAFSIGKNRKCRSRLERQHFDFTGVGPVCSYFTASSKYLSQNIVLVWRKDE